MPRPSFHKLVLPTTLQSRQLRIPDNFLRKYGAQLSTVATLTVPGGTIWRLGLKKVDNRICFVDGWQDFIQRYSIGIGYLLVFTYEGNSNFIIHIFGTAELNYQSAMRSRTEGPFHENHHIFEDIEDIDSFDFMDSAPSNPTGALQGKDFTGCMDQLIPAENHILQRHENNDTKKTSRKKRKSRKSDLSAQEASTENDEEAERNRSYESASARVRSNVAYESASARVRGNVANEERERAMNEAAAFAPTNPFCLVVLRPSYLYRGCIMYLPSSFAANLNGVSDFIQLQTSDGDKQWHVRCLDKGGRIKLSQGWYEFTQENGLGEGDICVFELLNTRDVVLQVTFFRLKEDEPSLAAPR